MEYTHIADKTAGCDASPACVAGAEHLQEGAVSIAIAIAGAVFGAKKEGLVL